MARPNSNGIDALHDDKESNSGFFCMKLVGYLNEEAEMGTEFYEVLWHERFAQAKAGECAYRDKCPIYAKSNLKLSSKTVRLKEKKAKIKKSKKE